MPEAPDNGGWGWMSTATAQFEPLGGAPGDTIRVLSLSKGVIVYANQTEHPGIFRMPTKDMREFGTFLIEGADVLEARAAAAPEEDSEELADEEHIETAPAIPDELPETPAVELSEHEQGIVAKVERGMARIVRGARDEAVELVAQRQRMDPNEVERLMTLVHGPQEG